VVKFRHAFIRLARQETMKVMIYEGLVSVRIHAVTVFNLRMIIYGKIYVYVVGVRVP